MAAILAGNSKRAGGSRPESISDIASGNITPIWLLGTGLEYTAASPLYRRPGRRQSADLFRADGDEPDIGMCQTESPQNAGRADGAAMPAAGYA